MVHALCLDAGEAKLADLQRLSPRRFALWKQILAKAPTIARPVGEPYPPAD